MINQYSILNGAKYFFSDRLQDYLVFVSTKRIDLISRGSDKIESWGSAEMLQESIKNSHTSDTTFAPKLVGKYRFNTMKFKGILLKQDSVSFLHKKVVNLYIFDTCSKYLNTDFTLINCLIGTVNLTKNTDPNKNNYSDYGIGFDSRSQFSWADGSKGKNVIIFEADNSSYVHIDGRNKNIIVLVEDQHKA